MHFLFIDETNTTPGENIEFFASGGIIIPEDKILNLDSKIEKIRHDFLFSKEDSLKFDTRTRPVQVSEEGFAAAKNAVIEACVESGCKFISYVVLHEIAKNQGLEKTIVYGANSIAGRFNKFLDAQKSAGMVFIDRLPNAKEYSWLSEKFTKGLVFPHNKLTIPLKNIKVYSSTCNNASNFSSAADIVLGSFRYIINNPYNEDAAKNMLENLSRLAFREGFIVSPKLQNISIEEHREKYENLFNHLSSLSRSSP